MGPKSNPSPTRFPRLPHISQRLHCRTVASIGWKPPGHHRTICQDGCEGPALTGMDPFDINQQMLNLRAVTPVARMAPGDHRASRQQSSKSAHVGLHFFHIRQEIGHRSASAWMSSLWERYVYGQRDSIPRFQMKLKRLGFQNFVSTGLKCCHLRSQHVPRSRPFHLRVVQQKHHPWPPISARLAALGPWGSRRPTDAGPKQQLVQWTESLQRLDPCCGRVVPLAVGAGYWSYRHHIRRGPRSQHFHFPESQQRHVV